jgi:hypothetical protein
MEFDDKPMRFQQILQRSAHPRVIVNDRNNRLPHLNRKPCSDDRRAGRHLPAR